MGSLLERSRSRRIRSQARELVEECESFLTGQYPSVLQARGVPVPEWAWLSLLAHAPAETLMDHAAGGPRRNYLDRLNLIWLGAVALLTQELVVQAERTGCSVEELQHAVLVRLELRWVQTPSTASVVGPSPFVEEVRQALNQFRGSSNLR
ncbi:MAG: hypothetical protein IVW52_15520 [Acidimicrobiales bacterium]|nr:hypothetical protein [Acidimicrobiales bacterium]